MRILVILGHQRKGSFCHAIAATAMEELRTAGHYVVYHDLYDEGFDPILRNEEIALDARLDPIVARHCEEVTGADGYIVVHPNWWGQPPAILKGWLDRVLRQGHSYRFGPQGVVGLLKDKSAVVFTTSNTPRDAEIELFGDPLENLWKACVFHFCGVEKFCRRNFGSIILSTPEQRHEWLEAVRRIVRQSFPADSSSDA